MILLFYFFQSIIFLTFFFIRRGQSTESSQEEKPRLFFASVFLLLLFFFYLFASYKSRVHLIGYYTDFTVGIFLFAFTDYSLVANNTSTLLSKLYTFARGYYVGAIVFKVGALFFFGFLTGGGIAITHPKENFERTRDVKVLNRYYINAQSGISFGDLYNRFTIYRKHFIFKKELFETREGITYEFTDSELEQLTPDSLVALNSRLSIYLKDGKLHVQKGPTGRVRDGVMVTEYPMVFIEE